MATSIRQWLEPAVLGRAVRVAGVVHVVGKLAKPLRAHPCAGSILRGRTLCETARLSGEWSAVPNRELRFVDERVDCMTCLVVLCRMGG